MEPSLIGWEWLILRASSGLKIMAAMEPSLIGWEWFTEFAR